MPSTTEQLVREFAAQFPTPNVLRAVELCESGRIEWADVARIAEESLRNAMAVAR